MTISNLLIRYFAKSPALKKISNFFSKLFAITKDRKALNDSKYCIDKSEMIYCRSKNSYPKLKFRTQTQNPNPNPKLKTLNWINYKLEKPKFRTQNY